MSTHEMMEALSHFTMLALLVTLKLSISSCGTVQILMLGTIGITLPFMRQPLRAKQMSAHNNRYHRSPSPLKTPSRPLLTQFTMFFPGPPCWWSQVISALHISDPSRFSAHCFGITGTSMRTFELTPTALPSEFSALPKPVVQRNCQEADGPSCLQKRLLFIQPLKSV